jgi:cell division septum initiation protein DivIVA
MDALLDPRLLLFTATAIDLAAVASVAWLVGRAGREDEARLEAHTATLDRLRADIAALVDDAEQRGHALEQALGARESRLRALLADVTRAESAPRPRAPKARRTDPAEARLLRDLDVRLRAEEA